MGNEKGKSYDNWDSGGKHNAGKIGKPDTPL